MSIRRGSEWRWSFCRWILLFTLIRLLFFIFLYPISSDKVYFPVTSFQEVLPGTWGVSLSSFHLIFWTRRDSLINLKEHMFRAYVGDRLGMTLRQRAATGTEILDPSKGFQALYMSAQGDLPPLFVAFFMWISRNTLSLEWTAWWTHLVADASCSFLLARTLSGIKKLCQARDESVCVFIDRVKEDPQDSTLTVFTTGSCDKKELGKRPLYHVFPLSSTDFLDPKILIALWMMNPFLIWNANHQILNSLRSLCLVASVSFALIPSECPIQSFISQISFAFYLYLLPTLNGFAASIVLGAVYTVKRRAPLVSPSRALGYHLFVLRKENQKSQVEFFFSVVWYILVTAIALGLLYGLSYHLCGKSWIFWASSVGDVLLANDLSPNLSLYWYLKQLTFPPFDIWYFLVYNLISTLVILCCWLKLHRFPLTSLQIMCSVMLLFQVYCTGSDYVLLYCFLLLDYSVFQRIKFFAFQSGITLAVAGALGAKSYIWISKYTENPNAPYGLQMILFTMTSFFLLQFIRQALALRLGEHFIDEKCEKKFLNTTQ